jgi:fatty-acyl-CoA synthase
MGVKQVYPGRYDPEVLLKLFQKEKVTFSHCVPTILHMIVDNPATQDLDLSGWKVIIGGSALLKGLARAALERGIDVFTGYGMSETCPVLTLAQLTPEMLERDVEEQLEIRTKTGRPVPLVDLRVVDEEMRDVPHDGEVTGEVVVRSPWLTQGYLKEPEKSEELWRGGYLHTEDIGNIDPEGYLQVTDRIKDVIKSGGEWVSSLEIEDIISQHEGVSEAAVIGIAEREVGGATARRDRAQAGVRHYGGRDPGPRQGACGQWRDLQIRRARPGHLRGRDRQDERGQDRQEDAAREVRGVGRKGRARSTVE